MTIKLWAARFSCIPLLLLLFLIFALVYICWRFCKRNITKSSKHEASKKSLDAWDVEMNIQTPEKQVIYSSSNFEVNGDDSKNNSGEFFRRYTLKEIEAVTNGLAYENVIGCGEYGEVFYGVLGDNTQVAVRNLFTNRSGNKTFVKEAEAMMLIRHKNLVKLLGYCDEGTYRMIVCEYVDNGSLDYWLHKCESNVSPLTWNIRMKIIIGIAKGLAYLHEDTEPPVVHGNIKSSNILLDQQWNPKISEAGITQLVGLEWNHCPPTGMSGYIGPEQDQNQNRPLDVYSFGILIMEIVSGRTAILESTLSEIEEYLVDWIRNMVADENFDLIIDPELPELPSRKELKRILIIALRCVDHEVEKRPRMGQIIHMLEPCDLLLSRV